MTIHDRRRRRGCLLRFCYGFRPQIPRKDWRKLEKLESAPEPQLQEALSNTLPRHHFGGPGAQPVFTLLAVFENAAFNHSAIFPRRHLVTE